MSNVDLRLRDDRGFSLLELMLALAVLLTMSAGAFLALNQNQKVYVSTSNNATMYSSVRSAAEMITQEIGQAGSMCGLANACAGTTLTIGVSGGNSIKVGSTQGFFVGEKLTLDPSSSASEVVQILSIPDATNIKTTTSVTGAHVALAPVIMQGVFPQGVMSGSTATMLKLYGDINGDGTLVYVQYNCDFQKGQLTRSITPIFVAPNDSTVKITVNPIPDILIDNLIWKAPNGYAGIAYCFLYPPLASVTASDGITYSTTTQIQLLISVQSPNPDPQTHQYAQLTKSFLQISPRNVVAAYDLANNNVTGALQPTPQSVP